MIDYSRVVCLCVGIRLSIFLVSGDTGLRMLFGEVETMESMRHFMPSQVTSTHEEMIFIILPSLLS